MGRVNACLLSYHCQCHLEEFSNVTDICCREGFFTVLLSLSLCAVYPVILQAHSDIVVLFLFKLGVVVPFAEIILMS